MRIAFYTLGCKLNQSESEALASGFGSRGFSVLSPREMADIYIVSTCTVTSKAEQKARRMIRKFSRENPNAVIIITGCYVQLDRDLLEGIADNTFLVGQEEKDILLELPGYLNSHMGPEIEGESEAAHQSRIRETVTAFFRQIGEEYHTPDPFSFNADTFEYHSRAFLKVQDGCNNHCAYCRVTLARGDSVSLDLEHILERVRILEEKGYREIVLTGVNLTSWRDPAGSELVFPDMLSRVLETVKTSRIRLSSLEPETITPRLAEVLSHPKLCPHFHISVQSGSDAVLGRMQRKNNRRTITRGVELLRTACEPPFIAADIIVGFPGETEEDFDLSFGLMEELGFSELHVFPFSPRPGTAALTMKEHVPERVTGERTERIRRLSEKLHAAFLESSLGKKFDFLLEQPVEGEAGIWYGTAENYLKLPVVFTGRAAKEDSSSKVPKKGSIVKALVEKDSRTGYRAVVAL